MSRTLDEKTKAPGIKGYTGKKLTVGEHLFIWRRRSHTNQAGAALRFGVSLDRWRRWELDREEPAIGLNRCPIVGEITEAEHLTLLRRRVGYTQDDIADAIEVSRLWVNKMEQGEAPLDELRAFWEDYHDC